MYDTLHLWLPMDKAGKVNFAGLTGALNEATEHSSSNGGHYLSGSLKNGSKVGLSERGITFKGSLAKYFLQDNFQTLTRSDSQRAIEMLSDELHLPMSTANVSRIDFAESILMQHAPEAYYPYLGESKNFKKLMQPNSIYWQNGNRTKLFYNKIAEAKAKRLKVPTVWSGQNVLRFETRWQKRLTSQFNVPEITAAKLYDEAFYMEVFQKWHSEYEAIRKRHNANFNPENMNSPKDFWKQLQLIAIEAIGHDEVMSRIEQMRKMKAFDKPEYYSRLKKEVRELCTKPKLHQKSELVSEMDKKIKDAARFYR